MKKWMRLFLFLVAFQVDVTLKAQDIVVQEPAECLKSSASCFLNIKSNAFLYKSPQFELGALKESVFEKIAVDHFKYLEGVGYFKVKKPLKVQTVYGLLSVSSGEFWIRPLEKSQRILIVNVDSDLKIDLRDGRTVDIYPGFQNWISGIDSQGFSQIGMIEPLELSGLIKDLAIFHQGTKQEFDLKVAGLKVRHQEALSRGSDLYQNRVDRHIASVKAEAERVQLKKQKELQERRRVQQEVLRRAFER